MRRQDLLEELAYYDPDELVDMLNISTAELLKKFPKKVQKYVEAEADDDDDSED